MTPVPLELPLRPAEAAAVANLVFDQAERKPLSDDLRSRLAARASVLRLTHLTPYFGSLERDPVHPSTYYLAVDGAAGEPLLLHMAPVNAPTSSLFAKPLLVGRMPRAGGPEMVINCLPFGAADRENVEKFAASTDPRFLPRPLGPRPAIVVESARPEVDLPVAFAAFRALLRRTGKNLAAFAGPPEVYAGGLWAAIRAGWREGYGVGAAIPIEGGAEETREAIRRSAGFSRFIVAIGRPVEPAGPVAEPAIEPMPPRVELDGVVYEIGGEEALRLTRQYGPALQAAAAAQEWIRQARSALKIGRSFDLELSFEGSAQPTSPAALLYCLHWMKSRGQAVQLAAPEFSPNGAAAADLCAVARHYGCTLSVAPRPEDPTAFLSAVARAAMGRVCYRLAPGQDDLAAAISSAAAALLT